MFPQFDEAVDCQSLESFASQLIEKDIHDTIKARSVSTQSSPSEDCNLCIIEAPGGVSLVYWDPEIANATSNGNGTNTVSADEPYTHVESGFTLYIISFCHSAKSI